MSAAEFVEFEVVGVPGKKGDKSPRRAGNKVWLVEGNNAAGRAVTQAWATAVADTARDVAKTAGCFDGPLKVIIEFRWKMPASRPKAVRERGLAWKTSAPDVDKCERCTYDALKAGGLIADDARIVSNDSTKVETVSWTGAIIRIEHLDEPPYSRADWATP